MTDELHIPGWIAWLPGIAAGLAVIVPIIRKIGSWFTTRSSKEETARLLADTERRWADAFAGLKESRKEMHDETTGTLNDILGRLGAVERDVAGIAGELRAARGRAR